MIKVLHIVKALGLGGTEKVMQLMVSGLERSRFTPVVFSLKDGERASRLRQAGIETYIEGDLFSDILQIEPDIIHVHRGGWAEGELLRPVIKARKHLEAKRRSKGCRIPLVETNVFGRYDASPQGREIDCTLFVSHFCAERFGRQNNIPLTSPRWQVLYNPIDFETIARNTIPPEQRDFSHPVAGRISRADPGKWSELAMTWLPEVCARKPDFKYQIIGGIEFAEHFVCDHGLGEQVDFLPPFIDDRDLATFLNGISIFCHANDTGESFGLVIAEAMAAGLPVITHPAEGLRDNAQLELVDHEKTGLIVNNAQEYAAAVLRLLDNPEEARRMGEAGKKKAGREFAQAVIAAKLEKIYLELLTGNS